MCASPSSTFRLDCSAFETLIWIFDHCWNTAVGLAAQQTAAPSKLRSGGAVRDLGGGKQDGQTNSASVLYAQHPCFRRRCRPCLSATAIVFLCRWAECPLRLHGAAAAAYALGMGCKHSFASAALSVSGWLPSQVHRWGGTAKSASQPVHGSLPFCYWHIKYKCIWCATRTPQHGGRHHLTEWGARSGVHMTLCARAAAR